MAENFLCYSGARAKVKPSPNCGALSQFSPSYPSLFSLTNAAAQKESEDFAVAYVAASDQRLALSIARRRAIHTPDRCQPGSASPKFFLRSKRRISALFIIPVSRRGLSGESSSARRLTKQKLTKISSLKRHYEVSRSFTEYQ